MPAEVRPGQDEPVLVAGDHAVRPAGVRGGTDEDEHGSGRHRLFLAGLDALEAVGPATPATSLVVLADRRGRCAQCHSHQAAGARVIGCGVHPRSSSRSVRVIEPIMRAGGRDAIGQLADCGG